MKFMSVGSNCADLSYLGKCRVKGPVDNWLAPHGLKDVVHLFTDFEKQIREGYRNTEKRDAGFIGDSDVLYIYDSYACPHLNMSLQEKVDLVLSRIKDFREFWNQVNNESNCYFSYTLSRRDVSRKNGKQVLNDDFLKTLGEIKKFIPLKKFLIVGSKKPIWEATFNSYIDVVPKGILYIELCGLSHPNTEGNKKDQEDFISKVNKLVGIKPPQPPKSIKATKKPAPKRTEFHEDYWDE